MSKLPELQVESFNVSYSFDIHLNGRKSTHFVSMGFRHEPCSIQEAQVLQVEGSLIVTTAAIHDALARGVIQINEANDLIEDARTRHQGLAKKLFEDLNSTV